MTPAPDTSRPGPSAGRAWIDPASPRVLRLAGEVDVETVEQLCEALGVAQIGLGRALAAAGVREIDLSEATFIDSAVVALVVGIVPPLRPERLRVRGASGSPLATLQLTGVDALLELV
ncbi:STAS domain-containing protein [Cellulomonas sp. Marseille-Q8402]